LFSLFQNFQNALERVRNHFFSKVNYILSESDISRLRDKTKNKMNDITTEAELSRQAEMITRALDKREQELDEKLKPERDIQKGKDLTREQLYQTLRNKKKEKTFNR